MLSKPTIPRPLPGITERRYSEMVGKFGGLNRPAAGRLESATVQPLTARHADPTQIGIPDSPFLTVAEAARLCRFDATAQDPEAAFRKWAWRNAVPARRRGRVLLFDRRVIETFLRDA
jgi:hypothetical protein